MKEKLKTILIFLLTIILLVIRYIKHTNISVDPLLLSIQDMAMIALIAIAFLKKPVKR